MCDEGADLFILENATHWVQHDEPQRVNELILDFLQRP
jgi:pimeloyl-ACP methyl ester carboxylesterase